MKILLIHHHHRHYDSKIVRDEPSGGTEKAFIFLGEAFQKLGHEVKWITTTEQPIETGWADVVITQEALLLQHFPDSVKRIWWVHHFTDQPVIKLNSGYGRAFADKIVTLSISQQKDFRDNLKLDSVLIGHGVWLDEVVKGEKDPYRLIYASTPFRGLERIPELFRAIKQREPRASIAICSSMGTYGKREEDSLYLDLFNELESIDGVELKGALNQHQLYVEMAKASVFFYPCIWPETYCMVMDEAMAHGCLPVVSDLGALRERVSYGWEDTGILDNVLDIFKLGVKEIKSHIWVKTPIDWLEVGRQWEEEVLGGNF